MDHKSSRLLEAVHYSDDDLGSIFAALNVDEINAATARLYRRCFHRAVLQLASIQNYRSRVPDASLTKRLDKLAKAADRMVRYGYSMLASKASEEADLGRRVRRKSPHPSPARFRNAAVKLIKLLPPADEDCPSDQFPDRALAIALTMRGAKSDRNLIRIYKAIAGYEQDVKAANVAAALLARRARRGVSKVRWVRESTVGLGHTGDAAFNGWIDDMLSLYVKMAGKPVRTSVGRSGSHSEGIAYGPVIEFLKAAIAPINLKLEKARDAQNPSDPPIIPAPWFLNDDACGAASGRPNERASAKDAALNTWVLNMFPVTALHWKARDRRGSGRKRRVSLG